MRKVLIAFDGTGYSEGAMNLAYKLNEFSPILLTGVFLPQTQLADLWSYADAESGSTFIPLAEEEESNAVSANIERFRKSCEEKKIAFAIHKDFLDLAIPSLTKESVFADLLILASETFYQSFGTKPANEYLEETLHEVDCPVILVPEEFNFPQSIILAYDGSKDSVYAIKQFSYLFPELCKQPTLVAYVTEKAEAGIPGEREIKELVNRHYNMPEYVNLQFDARKYFSTWIAEKQGAILVSGSYGRTFLSKLFKKSFVHEVIGEHKIPVFIAHK